jgi:hypothetical protein
MHCQALLRSQGAALDGIKPVRRLPAGKMATKTKGKKRGPKTPWQNRAAYNRARCIKRLKPGQVENLASADAFAAYEGTGLNGWLTIKFASTEIAFADFQSGSKRLSEWFRRSGGNLIWVYVWESVGGVHIHMLIHIPNSIWQLTREAIAAAFDGHDVLLKRRTRGPIAVAYLCKGTDLFTLKRIARGSKMVAKRQGIIGWKRCGTSESIGLKARQVAGFDGIKGKNNCAETYTRQKHSGE